LTPVRTLEFTISSGAITAKTPGANTPKSDTIMVLDVKFHSKRPWAYAKTGEDYEALLPWNLGKPER
jgi:hypothetical protein